MGFLRHWVLVAIICLANYVSAFVVGDTAIPIVRKIDPIHGSILGGTKVRVTGDNFDQSAVKWCVFWGNGASIITNVSTELIEIVPVSKYMSQYEVVCIAAASKKVHNVHLVLHGDEELASLEGTLTERGHMYRYYDEPEILSVRPESSWTTGNSTVNIFGGPFFNSTGLFCSFGGVRTSAVFVGPTQIACQTPPHPIGTYALEISQNGQDFTRWGYPYRFYHPSNIKSIYPAHGPAQQAGTKLTVRGEDFVNSTSLRCRFESVVLPAIFVSSSEVHCRTPPIKKEHQSWLLLPEQRHRYSSTQLFPTSHAYPSYLGRLVSFELTNNGQDFTDSGQMFLYQNDIRVVGVSASAGPSKGGTPVFISGSNFVNSTTLSCRFGKEVTKANFLTRESILCFSTPIYAKSYRNSKKDKTYPILVSNNAIDYSYAGEFVYTAAIPKGMYRAGIDDGHLLGCPRGAYCSELLESNFTLCSPGTYQTMMSQSRCLPCPIGYVCAEFGMPSPFLCPAGYVCDERGMSLAKPCPPGFVCDRGTATFDTECLNSNVLASSAMKSGTSFSTIGTCFDNSTDDFGLQSSIYPVDFWSERHLVPLDSDESIQPTRGKFCLEDSCLKLEDANNVEVCDDYFDYHATGVALRRPRVCPPGLYCNAGTAFDVASSEAAAPRVCKDGFHCAEGSSNPKGIGVCMLGFFCRLGIQKPCPVGTFCPHDDVFDPIPCEPGTFNFMIGQAKCSTCPIGYFCPKHGQKDPTICPPGFVCSKKGLASPNIRCPAGFYCQNGTQTSDPFRNDTTLRPYACSPGTYCLTGTGYNEVREDAVSLPVNGYVALYSIICPAGFFCEAASISAKGSGPCPPGFICPRGTANPRPTPKGHFAEHIGTVDATACLPGFYAPTIENEKCYTCPPGTSCSVQGLWEAEECPPGTYRSTTEADGNECVSCPQGTWSKNWQLREKGECTSCPTGVICPLDGMTNPCSFGDLPTPYEPIVNFRGMPAFEYDFPGESMPPRFSMDECLALNSLADEFFFGELVPPYIDVLGRGAHFRPSDQQSLKYQREAKCYKNSQPYGSLLYQRMADYYGPQFDIQSGYPHQGYGSAALLNQMIAASPPPGYDFELRYGYFRGRGHGYIDLPTARSFDPSFNCTRGFKLMNSSLVTDNLRRIVYTDPDHDFEGGYDVEQCSTWDSALNCYIDPRYEVHEKGECCNVNKYQQRAIFFAEDQFYEGTCEADRICSEGRSAAPQARACDAGFVCDEATSLDSSLDHPCPAGYICDFATTPDTSLISPNGQLKRLCKEGFYCPRGTGIKEKLASCPEGYFCPSGTADPLTGQLANDGMLRLLGALEVHVNLHHQNGDEFYVYSDHESMCNAATRSSLQKRFDLRVEVHPNVNHLEFQSDQSETLFAVKEATEHDLHCSRDNKSSFIRDAMRRRECSCREKFFILSAVYRLWKCTSDQPLDNFSFADTLSRSGKRDYWFPNSRIHRGHNTAVAMDPSMEIFGIDWGSGQQCKFDDSGSKIGLAIGRLPFDNGGYLKFDSDDAHLTIQFTYTEKRTFNSYLELKADVTDEYSSEHSQVKEGTRSNVDPYVFDLYHSVHLIEQYGEKLEELIEMQPLHAASNYFSGPLGWCNCQGLLRCPNGTMSGVGSVNIADCEATKDEVLGRISLLPNSSSATSTSTVEGIVDLSPTLKLKPYEVAVLTIDQSELPTNFTYGDHYQFSIYDGCKPCPLRYQCNQDSSAETSCKYPSQEKQLHHINHCLKENKKMVCILPDESYEDAGVCKSMVNATIQSWSTKPLIFWEPDIEVCSSRPYSCADKEWHYQSFRRLCQDTMPNGKKSPVYDCVDVHRWQLYTDWRNGVCCSSTNIPELRDIDTCDAELSVCRDDPIIEEIIREKMISVFELEFGFIPPMSKPLGQLVWNSTVQEQNEHDTPLDLFNKWQEPFDATRVLDFGKLHNQFKPELSKPWISTHGCCKCKRHSMPFPMDSNLVTSGFPDDKHQPVQIAISALSEVELTVVAELLHGYYYIDFIDFFGSSNKSALNVHTPSRFTETHAIGETATVLSLVERATFDSLHLDLPLNLPINIVDGNKDVEMRFLVDRPINITIGDVDFASSYFNDRDIVHQPTKPIDMIRVDNDWFSDDFWALPYIPFFSNCDGYGSHISWSRLLEDHPDCNAVSHDEVVLINEFSFRNSRLMKNDACHGVSLRCVFDEEVKEARENMRWYEAAGSTLFYITRDAVPSSHFVPSSGSEEWGRTFLLDQLRNSYDIIPVSIDKEMSGYRHAIPRHIELEVKYFQMTKSTKRLVEAKLYYDEFCTTEDDRTGNANILSAMSERGIEPCEVDVNGMLKSHSYNLELKYFPLNWFDLLNRFEFKGSVYFLLYTGMGIAVTAIGGFVYGTNRLLTKLRYPPKFQGLSLIKLVTAPQIQGCALALIPYMTIMSILCLFFGATNTNSFGFDSVHSKWSIGGLISETQAIDNSVGRLGSSLLVLGFWITYKALQNLIPMPQDKLLDEGQQSTNSPANIVSKRSHFITISFCVQCAMLCFLEFSYSEHFKDQIYRFVVLFRICSFVFDLIMSNMMQEKLLMAPLMVLVQMTEVLITIGARDFLEFSMTFFIKVTMLVALRMFVYPLIKTVSTLWPRWRMLVDQAFSGKGLTRAQKKDREMLWKKINEEIELRTEGVEPLLDAISIYSIEKVGSLLIPFMCLMLMYLYPESEIARQYDINRHELLYYGTFAFYMIPWMSFVDAFILSSQELLYGWRVYDYFSYQRWRFTNREHRWNLFSQVDESVASSLQSIDVLCFSSQYYYILTVLTLGFGTNIFGATICLRRQYLGLGDPVFPFIVATVVVCCEGLHSVCSYIADLTVDEIGWDGIWKVRLFQGCMDDVVAAKLAIGEGRQEDLERERQEHLAMNNETFRHKFVEKNKPWILQHLVELITPRTLQDTEIHVGPDGQPLVDYVRQTYNNLMTVGEGVKRSGERSDISSDSSDDEFDLRRKWDRTPLDGSKLLIAQIWLQKARKRRVFTKAVSDLVNKRKEDHCSCCSRTLSTCSSLTAGLSWDGKFDVNAIDHYIKGFESKYSSDESDLSLWKAFFRETADFLTICNICLNGIVQQKLHKEVRPLGDARPTRAGDISSDDESDDAVHYDPLVLTRASNEGVLLTKWLAASRLKLGGKFPKKHAAEATQRYLEKLRQKKPGITGPARLTHATSDEIPKFDEVNVGTPGVRILRQWLRSAQQNSRSRYETRAEEIRSDLQETLSWVSPDDDWYFGSELRLQGNALKIEGHQILKEKVARGNLVSKQIAAMKLNLDDQVQLMNQKQQSKKDELEQQLAEKRHQSKTKIDRRTIELNRALDERPNEEESLRNQYSAEIQQEERSLASQEAELIQAAHAYNSVLEREIHATKSKYELDTQTMMERSRNEYVSAENNWRRNVALWMGKASKKIQQLEKERKPPDMSAKQARLEQRKKLAAGSDVGE